MALTKDRGTPQRANDLRSDPVAAATMIYAGAIVMLDASGNAVPGTTATGLSARGVAQAQVDNSAGNAGDKSITTRNGCHRFLNDGTITRADIGASAYVVDDETVANSDGGTTRSALGTIVDVEAVGVWVDIA
ncbi:hypothetical protein LZP69_10605 [Shewanella sp. AS1]|uniref:hypothetical protein n=1 Tax=Shewanella sp. AS1 TaxID=2907626 RepID=UPI001F318EFD|nr:hypothetical protein [Shewanella sp. AS1]MCE9679610.1 hypothetical protein [Shewanella sp. AS1]